MIYIYIFGGIIFYIIIWLWKSYQNILLERKYDKWIARMTLGFVFWPVYFCIIFVIVAFKYIKNLIKLSEF